MKLRSLWWAGVLACLVVAVGASVPGARSNAMATDKWEPSDFENASPAVESLDLTSLPAGASEDGNALLEIRYTLGQELPATIELTIDERKVALHSNENDPMLYTAIIDFDFDALIEEQEQRQQLAQTIRSVPVFDGRELAGNIGLAFLEPNDLRARVLAHESVRIPWETIFDIPGEVRPEKSLLITDTSVVQDPTRTFDYCNKSGGPNGTGNPDGAWSFKTLMANMADLDPDSPQLPQFVRHWMQTYGDRPSAAPRFFNEWPKQPGTSVLDVDKMPIRLLAIVNRLDIRNNATYGGTNAGEVRFVFGVLGQDGNNGEGTVPPRSCSQLLFTVILEFGIPKRGCTAVRDYGRQWKALGHLGWGSGYNQALENATKVVTARNAAPLKPNGSALNQLRSNEISLIHPMNAPPSLDPIAENRLPWELREYHLDPGTRQLEQARAALTPERTKSPNLNVNGTARLARFINANATRIINNRYEVPQTYENLPFQANKSHNPHTLPAGVWNAAANPAMGIPAITNQLARHRFSLNTCNACHGSETKTNFLHILPRGVDEEADLSPFMVGDSGSLQNPGLHSVEDPVSHVVRQFGELHHRQQDLETLVNRSCVATAIFPDLLGNRLVIRSH